MAFSPKLGLGRSLVIAAALVAAGFFGAYLRFLPYLEREATYTDGRAAMQLDDVDRLRFAVWDEPVPLPPVINTEAAESRPALSPDGRFLVFAVGEPGLNSDLWVAEMIDGEPTDPRPLAALNTSRDELAPAFGPGEIYFASGRGGGRGGLDLYRAAWDEGVSGDVESLGREINTEADETDPATLPGTGALAFASNRHRGRRSDHDLYLAVPTVRAVEEPTGDPSKTGPRSERAGWDVQSFEAINTGAEEREPAFTADGHGVVFASDRRTEGDFDLYRSMQSLGLWQPAERVTGLDTVGASERGPWLSPDGFTLLFSHAPAGRTPDLQRARSIELFQLPGRPVGWLDLTILSLLLLLALLAWLGRRWEALDILYKCVLVSLLVHLLLMLWFRDVVVEPEPVELGEPGRTFRVQLAPSQQAIARTQERSGELERMRAETAPLDAPARNEVARVPSQTAQLQATAPAEQGALDVPAAAQPGAPARQPIDVARTETAAGSAVTLADAIDTSATRTASAPTLRIVAADGPAQRVTTPATGSQPARTSTADSWTPTSPDTRPSATALARPHVETPATAPPPRRESPTDLAGGHIARATSDEVAVAMPEVTAPAPDRDGNDGAGSTPLADAAIDIATLADRTPARSSSPPESSAPGRPERNPWSTTSNATSPWTEAGPGARDPLVAGTDRRAFEDGPTGLVSERSGAADIAHPQQRGRDGNDVALQDALPGGGPSSSLLVDGAASNGHDTPILTGHGRDDDSLVALATATRTPTRRGSSVDGPERWRATTGGSSHADVRPTPSQLALASPLSTELPETGTHDWEHTPYRTRVGEAKVAALAEHGGNEQTEKAVADGLRYLARRQNDEGFWGSSRDYDDKYGHVAVGKTAVCLLAFLGAGHTPGSDTEYSDLTRRAVDFLLDVQGETGHFGYSTSYSHGITTYALAECYALTKEARLRTPIEDAVAWILKHQHRSRDARRSGGWGYYYPDARTYDSWPRTSVTVWQIMALESARLGGLEVPDRAFADARTFIRNAHQPDSGAVLYAHDPERLRTQYWTLPGSTPAGLFALSLLGEDIAKSRYGSSIRYITERSPSSYRRGSQIEFVTEATGNVYFWYYGSLALFRHGGREWSRWNERLQDTLLPAQQADGSWRPVSHYADYAGDTSSERSYTTAMCVLTLEVYYRYFTPLLEVP